MIIPKSRMSMFFSASRASFPRELDESMVLATCANMTEDSGSWIWMPGTFGTAEPGKWLGLGGGV